MGKEETLCVVSCGSWFLGQCFTNGSFKWLENYDLSLTLHVVNATKCHVSCSITFLAFQWPLPTCCSWQGRHDVRESVQWASCTHNLPSSLPAPGLQVSFLSCYLSHCFVAIYSPYCPLGSRLCCRSQTVRHSLVYSLHWQALYLLHNGCFPDVFG